MKLWNYIVIFTGVAVFMAMAGLPVAGFGDMFDRIGFNATINSTGGVQVNNFQGDSSFWDYFFDGSTGLLVALGAAGLIMAGIYFATKDKKLAMIPALVGVFALWVSVLISIINYTLQYQIWGYITIAIMTPLTVGFVITCVEWFSGE